MSKRTPRCTDCGRADGEMIPLRDAADLRHWFHADCWAAMDWFLSGHDDGKPSQACLEKHRAAFARIVAKRAGDK